MGREKNTPPLRSVMRSKAKHLQPNAKTLRGVHPERMRRAQGDIGLAFSKRPTASNTRDALPFSKRLLRVDLHTHTHYSPDSIISPRRFVEACRRKGINCVAVTDHNTIRGALAVRELADFPVIVGEEIRTAGG